MKTNIILLLSSILLSGSVYGSTTVRHCDDSTGSVYIKGGPVTTFNSNSRYLTYQWYEFSARDNSIHGKQGITAEWVWLKEAQPSLVGTILETREKQTELLTGESEASFYPTLSGVHVARFSTSGGCNTRHFVTQNKPTSTGSSSASNLNFIEVFDTIQFSASGQIDSNAIRDDLTFSWDFDNGATKTGANVSDQFTKAGEYLVYLTSFDGNFYSDDVLVDRIWVRGTPQDPRWKNWELFSCQHNISSGVLTWERSGNNFDLQEYMLGKWNTIYSSASPIRSLNLENGTHTFRIISKDLSYGPNNSGKSFTVTTPSCGGLGGIEAK